METEIKTKIKTEIKSDVKSDIKTDIYRDKVLLLEMINDAYQFCCKKLSGVL